ncbi:MAG: nucleotidyltransferase domain-containing protein [Candidatus Omnitrophica bacterium]|nr:nucleotidyltransferase domain-containing protein [Candidatus Omnitrophota bacterium]
MKELSTVGQRKEMLEEELSRIIQVLTRNYEPEKVILFGSLADDNLHEWSDIDLLIIKKTTKRPIDRVLEACRLINPRIGIDLFIYTPDEFDTLVQEKFSFLTNIAKRGKVLYEKRN